MLMVYSEKGVREVQLPCPEVVTLLQCAIWIDLLSPSPEEIRAVEALLDASLPTLHEAQEISVSSRLYAERRSLFMTATIIDHATSDQPVTTPVTFIYQAHRLVTLRYSSPRPFAAFAHKYLGAPLSYGTSQKVLVGLLDEIVNRLSDILEMVGTDLSAISRDVFATPAPDAKRRVRIDYDALLARVGQGGERASNSRESLVSLGRLVAYFTETYCLLDGEHPGEHWQTLATDIRALTDHATFLASKVSFALDAVMGRINVEQTGIIKLFSVLSIVFLPPTLIASIEGMNFEFMPELKFTYGYEISLGLMVLSAIGPYVFFKFKAWL